MVNMYNRRAIEVYVQIEIRLEKLNIRFHRDYSLLQNKIIILRLVNKIIKMLDAISEEERHMKEKFPGKYDLIDIRAYENILRL